MLDDPVVWFSSEHLTQCTYDADCFYELETGGALMGYWYSANAVVVTTIIESGPGAIHSRYNFEPDQQWQVQQIARHYERSHRRETYIGDWHSHPGAKDGRLSWTDRGILHRIIATPAARVPNPIMMILHGTKGDWRATAWMASSKPRWILWPELQVSEARLHIYESLNDGDTR